MSAQVNNLVVPIPINVYGVEVRADQFQASVVSAQEGFVPINEEVASVVTKDPQRVGAIAKLQKPGDCGRAAPKGSI
jgi:hypothetical protein